jgi:DivIVA domain-containing protein
MPIPPDEIAGKSFLITIRGYDRAEVDSYLRAIASDQNRLIRRIEELESIVGKVRASRGGTDLDQELVSILDDAVMAVKRVRRPSAPTTDTKSRDDIGEAATSD